MFRWRRKSEGVYCTLDYYKRGNRKGLFVFNSVDYIELGPAA
jgi:hypothetical protein